MLRERHACSALVRNLLRGVRPPLFRPSETAERDYCYVKAGKVKHKEAVVKGVDNAVDAFIGLFHGHNIGKMVVELA